MPETPISFGAYERSGNPTIASLNGYVEEIETPSGVRRQNRARSGLEAFKTVGSYPARCMGAKQGLFDDKAIIVSSTEVWTLSESGAKAQITGSIPGTNRLDMDLGQDADLNPVARFATGTALYRLTDTTLVAEDFPASGGAGASSVCYHRGFWFAVEAGTGFCRYLVPGDTAWTDLAFSGADYKPDPLVAVRSVGETVALLGSVTTEFWALTGQAAPAIEPYGGLQFDIGCRARDAAVSFKSKLIWVDNECGVRLFDGGAPKLISDPGLAEQIKKVSASDLVASAYTDPASGADFYVLKIGGNATWVYNITRPSWNRHSSLGYDYWRPYMFAQVGDATLAADSLSSQIYRMDATRRLDGSDVFTWEFCALVEGGDVAIPCANVVLTLDYGDGPRSGQGSDPLIGMCWSDDQGKTYKAWRWKDLPETGKFGPPVRWNALGQVPAHYGRIFKFRVSDPVSRIAKAVRMNVP